MPQVIPAQVAADAITNAKQAAWPNVFSGRMLAPNCPDPVLQWAILYSIDANPDTIQVYINFGGEWTLEEFQHGDASLTCQAVVASLQYLQEEVTITEYRFLSVSGALLRGAPNNFGPATCMDGFPHTWEPGMTTWLTPPNDLIESVLESSVTWNLDVDTTCALDCMHNEWPTPST